MRPQMPCELHSSIASEILAREGCRTGSAASPGRVRAHRRASPRRGAGTLGRQGRDGARDSPARRCPADQGSRPHAAEKLHAMQKDFGECENSRVRDLVDVVILHEHDLLDLDKLGAAVRKVWEEREGAVIPSSLSTFPRAGRTDTRTRRPSSGSRPPHSPPLRRSLPPCGMGLWPEASRSTREVPTCRLAGPRYVVVS